MNLIEALIIVLAFASIVYAITMTIQRYKTEKRFRDKIKKRSEEFNKMLNEKYGL